MVSLKFEVGCRLTVVLLKMNFNLRFEESLFNLGGKGADAFRQLSVFIETTGTSFNITSCRSCTNMKYHVY